MAELARKFSNPQLLTDTMHPYNNGMVLRTKLAQWGKRNRQASSRKFVFNNYDLAHVFTFCVDHARWAARLSRRQCRSVASHSRRRASECHSFVSSILVMQ